MSAFMRNARLASPMFLLFQHRCFTAATTRFNHNLCVRKRSETNLICRRGIPTVTQHVAQVEQMVEPPKNEAFHLQVKNLERNARLEGFVRGKQLRHCLTEMETKDSITSFDANVLLKCTGLLSKTEDSEENLNMVEEVWSKVQAKVQQLEVWHFNSLLWVYLEKGVKFSPVDFLSQMNAKGIQPNKATYSRLLKYYCLEGELELAKEIMEVYKQKEYPLSVQLYNSLLLGYFKVNNLNGVEVMYNSMKSSAISPGAETYAVLLSNYASLDLAKFNEVLETVQKDVFGFTPNELWSIVKPLLEADQEERALEVVRTLKTVVLPNEDRIVNEIQIENAELVEKYTDVMKEFYQKYNTYKLQENVFNRVLALRHDSIFSEQWIGGQTGKKDIVSAMTEAFYTKKFEEVENLKNTMEQSVIRITSSRALSCLVSFYSAHKKDLESARYYWKTFVERVHSLGRLDGYDEKTVPVYGNEKLVFQPLLDYCRLLLETDNFDEMIASIEDLHNKVKLTLRSTHLQKNYVTLLDECLTMYGYTKVHWLQYKLHAATNDYYLHHRFVQHLCERNPIEAVNYFSYLVDTKRLVTGLVDVLALIIKQERPEFLHSVLEKVSKLSSSETVIQQLALAFILAGKKDKASILILDQGLKLNLELIEKMAHQWRKRSSVPAKALEDLVEVIQKSVPVNYYGRLLAFLADKHCINGDFDKASELLQKFEEEELMSVPDVFLEIALRFKGSSQEMPFVLHGVSENESVYFIDEVVSRGVRSFDRRIRNKLQTNPDVVFELVKRLAQKNIPEMLELGKLISMAGNAEILISLYADISKYLSIGAKRAWIRLIPFAYYNNFDVERYIKGYKEDVGDPTEVSPRLLELLQKKTIRYFRKYEEIAEDDDSRCKNAVCNAMWSLYCPSDPDKAWYYLQKLPEDHTLLDVYYTMEQVCESGQPEHVQQFWDMVKDRISPKQIHQIVIEKINFYCSKDLLVETLKEYEYARQTNIRVNKATLRNIEYLCRKLGTEVPEQIRSALEEAKAVDAEESEIKDSSDLESDSDLKEPKYI